MIADPSGSWEPSTAEAYIDQQVGTLNTNITDEISARITGDQNLQTQLNSEMGTRADQDANLNALINAGIREGGGVEFDIVPTQNSANGITSGGMYSTLKDSNIGFVDDTPTAGSDNLVKSGGVYLQNGVLNLSVLNKSGNTLARYASFAEAVQAIPQTYQYSGIQIKFLDTYYNYHYYRMLSVNWSADISNWEEDNPNDISNIIGINIPYLTEVALTNKMTSVYITKAGGISSASAQYFYSKVHLDKGLYLIKNIGGYNSNVAILSKTDAEMSVISPVIIDSNNPGKSTKQSFVFEQKDSGYVVISGNGSWRTVLYKIKPYGGVLDYLKKTTDSLYTEISDIAEQSYVKEYENIDSTANEPGYILSNGDINSVSTQFKVYKFPVTAGSVIKIVNTLHAGSSYAWAFYNSSSFSSATAVSVGPVVTSTDDETIVTVPIGATHLGITYYNSTASCYLQKKVPVSEYVQNLSDDKSKKYAFQYDGSDNLYVAYIIDHVEFLYWFKKCMANNLYTFYRVGYRNVTRDTPSVDNITSGDIVVINQTSSDNIGPMDLVGGWVGGNHLYPANTASPNYKTAETADFEILIDDVALTEALEGYCDSVIVNVHNIIYDPAFAPAVGDESLSTKLSDEFVSYAIRKNNIEVSVSESFVSTTQNNITRYYGMQSMFVNEEKYITPNGEFTDWVAVETEPTVEFSKEDYPNFNRFIEKSASNNTYQSAYLTGKGIGNHSKITSSDFIFDRSSYKCYHHLIGSMSGIAGKVLQWNGIYTFFKNALADNSDVLAYDGIVGNRHTLFINTKRAFSGFVPIPKDMVLKDYAIIEAHGITDEDGGQSFILSGEGIYINSIGTGSLIISIA